MTYPYKIEYIIQQEQENGNWRNVPCKTYLFLLDAKDEMAKLEAEERSKHTQFRILKKKHYHDEAVAEYGRKPIKTHIRVTLSTKSTVTTVKVDGKTYHVYIYENGMFTDVIVRNTKGHLVDEGHPYYKMIVDEALAFNAL